MSAELRERDTGGRFVAGTRAAAIAAGQRMYFTGKPCPRGHIAERFVSNFGCAECLLEQSRRYHAERLDGNRARCRAYAKRDPGGNRERSSAARYGGTRTPPWANRAEMQRFYRECPPGLTVDHIVPLNGKRVSGLHVLENLRYVSLVENCRKGRRFDG